MISIKIFNNHYYSVSVGTSYILYQGFLLSLCRDGLFLVCLVLFVELAVVADDLAEGFVSLPLFELAVA